jgi:flagellin-like protein
MKVVRMKRKGISPLIATILLIAFTVSVAAILGMWIPTFTKEHTEEIGGQAGRELYCAYGGVSVSQLQFCNDRLSGILRNTNLVDIGNVTVQVTFLNATSAQTLYLTQSGVAATAGHSNMSLTPNQVASFNVTIGGSNYKQVHVYTNCSNVYDDVYASDITSTC